MLSHHISLISNSVRDTPPCHLGAAGESHAAPSTRCTAWVPEQFKKSLDGVYQHGRGSPKGHKELPETVTDEDPLTSYDSFFGKLEGPKRETRRRILSLFNIWNTSLKDSSTPPRPMYHIECRYVCPNPTTMCLS